MIYRRQETHDHFWLGFLTGALAGGIIGVLVASEAGRTARQRLESTLDEVRSRFNGAHDPEPTEAPSSEPQPGEERPS